MNTLKPGHHIPLAETPGAAQQGDCQGGIRPCIPFRLLTAEQLYPKGSDEVAHLEALGFDFKPTCNPYIVWKSANPPTPFGHIGTLADLLNFIARQGAVMITADHELVILGNVRPNTAIEEHHTTIVAGAYKDPVLPS